MGPGSVCRAHAFGVTASIEARAIEISLRCVIGRSNEIEPAALFVRAIDANYIVFAASDEFGAAIGPRNPVGMAPAVAFAEPKKFSAAAKPGDFIHHVDPRFVFIEKNGMHGTVRGICEKDFVPVLETIQVLYDQLLRIFGPFHAGEVVVARVAGNVEPASVTAGCINHAHANGRIYGARNRVRNIQQRRISAEAGIGKTGDDFAWRAKIVNERKDANATRIELPVSDPPAVGTPAETIAQGELFFVDPIGGAVDDRGGPVASELGDFTAREFLDVNVVSANVGNSGAIWGEFCEEHRRRGRIATEFLEGAGFQIENPIVAARVTAPDLGGICENQDARFVFRPRVVVNLER